MLILFDEAANVLEGHSTADARALDLLQVDAAFSGQSQYRGRIAPPSLARLLAGRNIGRDRAARPGGADWGDVLQQGANAIHGGRLSCRGRGRILRNFVRGLPLDSDLGDRSPHRDRLALVDQQRREGAGHRRRHLHVHLVGDDLYERVETLDTVSHRLEPFSYDSLGDGLSDLGQLYDHRLAFISNYILTSDTL